MGETPVPSREELVSRAAQLRPLLRRHAQWAEDNRRLHDEVVEAMGEAGLFKLRVPRRYGGYESDAQTMVDVATELAQGDGSAAWTAAVWWIPTWMAGLFPDQVQDEVFSTPDVRVCGTLSPTATATSGDGGIVVNGRWGFISGALHSHWQEIIAVLVDADGGPQPVMALVPMSDLKIVDDWHTSGLSGTGSVSTVAVNLFVPAERVLPLGAVLQEQYASASNADSPIFRVPLLPTASASSTGTMVGLARAACAAFRERMADRKITYTEYQSQRDAPLTHLQLAAATQRADEAQFHADRLAELVDRKAATGEPWTMLERGLARAAMGAACRRARECVDLVADASGGSSVYRDVPIQRIARDTRAVSLHALMHPDTNDELYGRLLAGLPPNTLYI